MADPENIDDREVQELDEEGGEETEPSGVLLLYEYLESEKGHEIASRVLSIFEDLKKNSVEKSIQHIKFERYLQVTIVLAVVIATSILTWFGKFDSTVAVLFGTLVGYLFGKRAA